MNLHYCDLIADVIFKAIKLQEKLNKDMPLQAEPVKWDLHPTEGYLVSTKKRIRVTDHKKTKYLVTIEAVDDIQMKEE